MFARLRSLVHALMSRGDFEAGLTDELLFHIEQYAGILSAPESHRRKRVGARAWNWAASIQ